MRRGSRVVPDHHGLRSSNSGTAAKTVLLELQWVLHAACKLPWPDIHSAIGN